MKVFGFMFYVANRKKKSSKSKDKAGHFDKADFDATMKYTDADLVDTVGHQCVNQYLCAIRRVVQKQNEDGLIDMRKDDIMTTKVQDLMKDVKGRCERVIKKLYKERVTSDFEPYRVLSDIPKIEEYIWNENKNKKVSGSSGLRDRFQLLFSLSGVLRSDSIYKADLSDLLDFKFKQKNEPDPYHICILRVGEGKTVINKCQFGKIMRHRKVHMCAMGALGFWLFSRFMVTDEVSKIDFTKNESWFNIKLLCPVDKRNARLNGEYCCYKKSDLKL